MAFFDFLKPVGSYVKKSAVGLEHTAANAVDVVNAGVQGVAGLASIAAAAATHNREAENNAINRTQKAVDYSLNASRGAYTPEEAKSKDITMSFLKPLARNTATYAPFFVAPTIFGAAGDAAAGFFPSAASEGALNLAKLGASSGEEGLTNLATQTALRTPIEATLAGRVGTGLVAGEAFNTAAGVAGQAANGQKINVGEAAKEAIPATLLNSGIDLVHESFGPLKDSYNNLKDSQKEIVNNRASEYSGLQSGNVINDNGVHTLRDYVDYLKGEYKPEGSVINTLNRDARNYAQAAGIDVTTGSPQEVASRVDNYISQRTQHLKAMDKISQSGSLGNSESTAENLAKETNVDKIKNELDGIVPDEKLDVTAKAIAATNDPHVVSNILKGGHDIPTPVESAPIPAPKDVKSAIDAEVQNRLANPAPETPPVDTSVAPNTTPDTTTPQSASDQVIEAIKSAAPIREAQEASYSAERAARIGAANAAGADTPGLAGHQAELAALKGELGKQTYTGLSEKLAPEAQDNLFTTLRQQVNDNTNIQDYQRLNTNEALRKVIYGDSGVPTRSEIALLKNAFGGEFADTVQSEIKSSLGEKAFSLWRTGLLTGPQTITKIITSHLVQGGKVIADKIPTAAVDKFVSLFTGQRSTSATTRGIVEGWKLGTGDALTYLRSGVERIDPGNTLELRNSTTFNSKILQGYNDFVGRFHGSLYKPFSGAAFQNSLFDQAITGAKNAGLSGAEAEGFIQDFVKNPSESALKIAKSDANEATFQQETKLGQVASAIQKKGGILGKVIVPFTKIPSAIATDLINYSPIGAMSTIIKGIKAATSEEGFTLADQRAFSRGLGQSITGSAAIIPGIILYNKGIMTLGYPTDPNEQKLWAAEGKIPNAVKIGGQWRSLGSLGPLGSVLSIGGHIADSTAQGNDLSTAVLDGFVGGAQSVEEQSYLRGVSGAVNAVNDPGRYASSFAKQTAGSIIPTGIATLAGATDPLSRQQNSILDAVKSRVPGVRQTLAPKIDAFGNPIKAPETGFEKILDPFQSSTATPSTELSTALRELQNSGHGIVPSAASKKTTFDKVKTPLPPQLLTELTTNIGQKTQDAWSKIVASDAYQRQTDPAKQKQMLQTIYDRIVAVEKTKFARLHHLGRYSPDYRANVKESATKKVGVLQ